MVHETKEILQKYSGWCEKESLETIVHYQAQNT